MFDRRPIHIHQPVPQVTINQQPANAADAARLYGELKDKATKDAQDEVRGALIKTLGAQNEMRVISVTQMGSFETDRRWVQFVFELNGRRHHVKLDINDQDIETYIAGELARHLFEQLTRTLGKRIFG